MHVSVRWHALAFEAGKGRIVNPSSSQKCHVTSLFQVVGHALKDVLERVTNRSTHLTIQRLKYALCVRRDKSKRFWLLVRCAPTQGPWGYHRDRFGGFGIVLGAICQLLAPVS